MSRRKGTGFDVRSMGHGVTELVRTALGAEGGSWRSRLISLVMMASFLLSVALAINVVLKRRPRRLVLATARPHGEYRAFGEALKQVVEEHSRRGLKLEVDVIPTSGSYENMRLLQAMDVDLALAQNDTPAFSSVRSIATLFPECLHLIVAEDANIDAIPDLKGKCIAVMPNLLGEGNDPESFFGKFCKYYGLADSGIRCVPLDHLEDARAMFENGDIQAVFFAMALGNEWVRELLTSSRVELLPIHDVDAMRTWHPYLEKAEIPAGTYRSVPDAIPTNNVATAAVHALLLTHKGTDKKTIREVTRVLYEHRNALLRRSPRAYTIHFPDSGENLGIPPHTGATSYYYKSRPGFLVVYAEVLAFLLALTMLIVSGIWHLQLALGQRQKDRADKYNTEILGLVDRVRASSDLEELEDVRGELFGIFKRIIDDLDHDRISPESFQLFAFPWEMAISAIRHRELMLLSRPGDKRAREGQSC